VNADALTCQALLNCLIREVSEPEQQTWHDGGRLFIRLARSGTLLRAGVPRQPAGTGPRPSGEPEVCSGRSWRPIAWEQLAELIAAELTLATGVSNEEFAGQVRASHAALTAITQARAGHQAPAETPDVARFLASEQALVAGHRFHPAPKARPGAPGEWLRYAPEAGGRFPLRFLGVRDDVLAEEGDTTALDRIGGPAVPAGYRLLPAHPWQLRLLAGRPWFRAALDRGLLVDLGEGDRQVAATSSVRTVYEPRADVFAKFSLNVRLTNCVRKSAWYELAGSVALTRLLTGVLAEVTGRAPGAVLLGEPGYRTVALASREAYEGLAVIVRDGLRPRIAPGVTPLLAAALTEPHGQFFAGRPAGWLLGWWEAYLRLIVPPVIDLFFRHGVVLEPHLQNVLAGVDDADRPVQMIFRDLEGVKLVTGRHEALLASLPPGVAAGLAYDSRRGWDRVAYCLFVNHLAEVAAAIAAHTDAPGVGQGAAAGHGAGSDAGRCAEAGLWRLARDVLTTAARDHGWPPELRAVLAGVPLPGKANLRARWARSADRDAGYVPVPNPLGARHDGD
jgi:siderophore synthetase component